MLNYIEVIGLFIKYQGVYMVKKILILILIILTSSAYADDYDNFNSDGVDYSDFNNSADDKYRDWKNVLSLLATKSVDTNNIDWDEVADSCSHIQNKRSGTDFNKCKYNNAIKYASYQKDSAYCDASAQQKYFDYIKKANHNIYPGDKKIKLTQQEEKEFKDSAASICMRKSGWSDPHSWSSGKSNVVKRNKNHR